MIKIDELIAEAIKAKKHEELEVYRAIKAEILNYMTAKNAKPYDEVAEIGILKKMCKQREDSCEQYQKAGRQDLYDVEKNQLEILKVFLPKPVTEEEIQKEVTNYCTEVLGYLMMDKKDMGGCIKFVKSKLPAADGKLVSDIVRKHIK